MKLAYPNKNLRYAKSSWHGWVIDIDTKENFDLNHQGFGNTSIHPQYLQGLELLDEEDRDLYNY